MINYTFHITHYTLFFPFLYNLSQVRNRNLVRGAAEVASHFEVLAFFFEVLQVLERECCKRCHGAFAAAGAVGLRVDFLDDVDIVGAAQLVQELVEVKAFGRIHVLELRQVLDDDFDQVDVFVFEVGEGFDVETGGVVQLARVLGVKGGLDANGGADLFRLQQVSGQVLSHGYRRSLDDALVDPLALLVQLDYADALGNQGGLVTAHGGKFRLRDHGTHQALGRRVRLHQRDFAAKTGGQRHGSRKLQRGAQKNACDGVFGQELEGKTLCVVLLADFVHRRGQIDDNQAEGRSLARGADNAVLEIHGTKIEM